MTEHLKNKQNSFYKNYNGSKLFELIRLLNNFSSDDEAKSDMECEESVYYDNKNYDSGPIMNDEEFFKIIDEVFDSNKSPTV